MLFDFILNHIIRGVDLYVLNWAAEVFPNMKVGEFNKSID